MTSILVVNCHSSPQREKKMNRSLLFESEILLDVIVTYITRFLPRSGWFAFQLVSKQFLRCARELGHTAIRPLYTDLRRACKNGHLQSLNVIVGVYKIDPSVGEVFCVACTIGNTKVVALLLTDPRVDPSIQDNYAIRAASCYGNHEVVALLLADSRVDPSAIDN